MERTMLGVSLRDRIRNEVIRQRTKFTDIARWSDSALAISAVEPNTVTEFWSGDRVSVNSVERPQARWSDDLTAGGSWMRASLRSSEIASKLRGQCPAVDCGGLMMMIHKNTQTQYKQTCTQMVVLCRQWSCDLRRKSPVFSRLSLRSSIV
jgi:hypothetical protein